MLNILFNAFLKKLQLHWRKNYEHAKTGVFAVINKELLGILVVKKTAAYAEVRWHLKATTSYLYDRDVYYLGLTSNNYSKLTIPLNAEPEEQLMHMFFLI